MNTIVVATGHGFRQGMARPRIRRGVIACLALSFVVADSRGAQETTLEDLIDTAPAIAIATAEKAGSYAAPPHGEIRTRWHITVQRTLKGLLPPRFTLETPGGEIPGSGTYAGCAPRIEGTNGLFLLARDDAGALRIHGGVSGMLTLDAALFPERALAHAAWIDYLAARYPHPGRAGQDLRDAVPAPAPASVVYLLTNSAGIPSRFIACDRGEPIHYVVDAEVRPAGLSTAQVMTAISNAFATWKHMTSLSFVHDGYQTFPLPPNLLTNRDRRIWIQTGDPFLQTYDGILGYGGRSYAWSWNWEKGGDGGNVAGNEFFESTKGYVVLRSQDANMSNLKTFEEVVCHELGHVLGLDHTSERSAEPDPLLSQAVMYYRVHKDGRGARLNTTDVYMVRQVHPSNAPPFGFDRRIHIVTASPAPADTLANAFSPCGHDLQGAPLTLTLTNNTGWAGTFAFTNGLVRYTPFAVWSDSTGDYDSVDLRWSDGTNRSPPAEAMVVSFSEDRWTPSDGIPDNWMSNHFGHADGRAADWSRPFDDPDRDGMTNLEEYRAGFNPLSFTSCFAITSLSDTSLAFTARQHDLYEMQQAGSVTGRYQTVNRPVQAVDPAHGVVFPWATNAMFYRIVRVP